MLTECLAVARFIQFFAGPMIKRRPDYVTQFVANHGFIIEVFSLGVSRFECPRDAFAKSKE